jgi:hypothetical protein
VRTAEFCCVISFVMTYFLFSINGQCWSDFAIDQSIHLENIRVTYPFPRITAAEDQR